MNDKTELSGIIPIFQTDSGEYQMMFMCPSDEKYGGKKLQIAKGHVEKGENPLEAGLREANEELGLRENIIKRIWKCGVYDKRMHIYGAIVDSKSSSKFDKFTSETAYTKWLTLEEFLDVGYDGHKHIVKKCIGMLSK